MPLNPFLKRNIALAYRAGYADLPFKPLESARAYYTARVRYLPLTASQRAQYEDHWLPGGAQIRLHRGVNPPPHQSSALVIYIRSNGYVFGSIEQSDFFCHKLACYLGCLVAVIEPRISPEYKFPMPFHDLMAAVEYLYTERHALGIDANKMAIWGECSGGTSASALSHVLKEGKRHLFKQQVLFYPALDSCHPYPSQSLFGERYMMDNALRKWFLAAYTRTPQDAADVRVSPLLAENFTGLPPTLLIAAQYDPMRDENMHYLALLDKAGVPTKGSLVVPGVIHGFLLYAGLPTQVPEATFAQTHAATILKSALDLL